MTFLASIKRLHSSLAHSENAWSSAKEAHAREKVKWASEKTAAQSHARSLHEKLLRAEMQMAALSQDNVELMQKTAEDSKQLIEMHRLSDSRLQELISLRANGTREEESLLGRDRGEKKGVGGECAGGARKGKSMVSRLALGSLDALVRPGESEVTMRRGEAHVRRLNKPWTPLTSARGSNASECGEGVDGKHGLSMSSISALGSSNGGHQQNSLGMLVTRDVSALYDNQLQLHETRRDHPTSM
jgi:hypothetical protein